VSATVVTRKGREVFTGRMIGASPTQAEPKVLAWGLDPADAFTAANTDIASFQESAEARVTGTSSQVTTTTTNDTYQVTGTISASAPRAITEAALCDSTVQPAQAAVAAGGVVGSSSSTALNTAATFSLGNSNFVQIRTEVMQVTAGSGTAALTVLRAQNGTSAIATITVADNVAPGNPPGQTGIAGGTLLAHADFPVINLGTSDSIAFTWKVSVA
jgi:hypothetical protein